MAMKIKCREGGLSASAKRVLATLTLHALLIASSSAGEGNDYTLVISKSAFDQSFPSLTSKRLRELMAQLFSATFSEQRLGYFERRILIDEVSVLDEGTVSFTVSAEYMDCVFKLGCLPS